MFELDKNKKYSPFIMEDIFEIVGGYYNKKPPASKNGDLPFLGATAMNNGITQLVNTKDVLNFDKVGDENSSDIDNRIFEGNCIAITNNGSVGNAYYQEAYFTCSHDMTIIYLKENTNIRLNKELAFYLIVAIEQTGKSFKYSRKWRPKRMRSSKILLPINNNGNPDWNYMKTAGQEIYNSKNSHLINYLTKQYKKLQMELEDINLREWNALTWEPFVIEDYFKVQIGKTINGKDARANSGNVPYITRKTTKNGLEQFIENFPEDYLFDNPPVITVGNETAKPFVQVYPFYTGTKVNILTPKFEGNKYNLMFIARAIENNSGVFSYSFTINSTRLKALNILLPINTKGEPDWHYMEKFMKEIEFERLSKLLTYYS